MKTTISLEHKDVALVFKDEIPDVIIPEIKDEDEMADKHLVLAVAIALRIKNDREWVEELYDWFDKTSDKGDEIGSTADKH